MHAVLKPASDRPKAALRPAPPAPTTIASYSWSMTVYSPTLDYDWEASFLVVELPKTWEKALVPLKFLPKFSLLARLNLWLCFKIFILLFVSLIFL